LQHPALYSDVKGFSVFEKILLTKISSRGILSYNTNLVVLKTDFSVQAGKKGKGDDDL